MPLAQAVQLVEEIALVAAEYVPAAHAVHSGALVGTELNVPKAHAAHETPALYRPGAQVVQNMVSFAPASLK